MITTKWLNTDVWYCNLRCLNMNFTNHKSTSCFPFKLIETRALWMFGLFEPANMNLIFDHTFYHLSNKSAVYRSRMSHELVSQQCSELPLHIAGSLLGSDSLVIKLSCSNLYTFGSILNFDCGLVNCWPKFNTGRDVYSLSYFSECEDIVMLKDYDENRLKRRSNGF